MKDRVLDRAGWAVAAALAIALIASFAGVVRGGPLDPPGPPSSTLPLVEPRTPIRQPASAAGFPIVISISGSYYLAENITGVSGKDGIQIMAPIVTLDLNGFVLTGVFGSGAGIISTGSNVTVRNGTVMSWNGDGVQGDGSTDGVYEDLRLTGNGGSGVRTNGSSLIRDVVAVGNGGHGILMNSWIGIGGGIIRDSTAQSNGLDGIQVLGHTLVVDNSSINNGGFAVHVYNSGNRIDSNNLARSLDPLSLAIKVENANNVIVRNSIRGANSDVSIVPGNTAGQLENAGTPISNPWANVVY